MLSLRIAARFLRTSPVQSGLIIGGIAVGIALQIFVGSLITSLQASLVDTTVGSAPHITIQSPTSGDPVRFTPQMERVMTNDPSTKPGTVVPVRITNSLFTQGSDTAPLNLIGGNLKELDGIYKISDRMVEGNASLANGQIMVGTDFAKKYGIGVGDTVQLTFQGDRAADFKVSGIFDLGAAAFNERSAFVNGQVPQDILGYSNDEYTAVYAQVADPFQAGAVAASWRRQIPDVEILDWQAQNADLLVGLQSQTSSSILIQSFVLIAVALGIASTLAISAVQKTRQIGILKAMGMRDRPSGLIFLYEALILGGLGSLSGVLLAFALIALFGLAPLTFTVVPEPGFVALSASIGILVAVLSSIIPSRRTSKLDPIEVIQSG